MDREHSLLLIIDLQQKLLASIPAIEPVVATSKRLIDAADLLRVPICVTEHCPDKIGPTTAPLKAVLRDEQIMQKVHFSAALEKSFQARINALKPRQIIVCGTEAHVCVLQTVLLLQAQGFDTFLVTDASASRRESDRDVAFLRASQEGVRLVSSEMVLFEWVNRADCPEFRDILSLVKSRD